MSSKIAIVTGAGSGVGRSTTLALLSEGYNVVLAGRRAEVLDQVIAEAGADPSRTLAVPTDITSVTSVQALFARTKETFGRLDLLFNNAGTNISAAPIEDISFENWQTVLSTNVTGAFLCTQEAVRMMKNQTPQGGRIINNGSVSSQVPRPFAAPYNASKHAITGLTRSTALEGRPFNIACGQIDIGNALTYMAAKMHGGVRQADGSIAPEPTMDVENVARSVIHMAGLPLDANVLSMTVMATGMPFVGRG